jgi:NADP-dependent 3-hydroxy acid dehydrogenase YdfG
MEASVADEENGQVAGKVVAITDAGRGIGAASARLLAARGARVVLGSRGGQELAATAGAIAASGGEVAYQSTDVTEPQELRALVDLAMRRFGRLDALAGIAGVAVNAPLGSGQLADWSRMIDVTCAASCTASAPRCRSFVSRGRVTSSRSHPPPPTSGSPARPSTPPPSPRCAPCAR